MSNIEEICAELLRIDCLVAEVIQKNESEQAEISNEINKAQGFFGASSEGQLVVQELFGALNSAIYANSSLCALRSEITQIINRIRN